MSETPSTNVDVKAFWQTLGERPIGATIVTAMGKDGPVGFLGLSASHVTASPPTLLVSVDHKTHALAAILEQQHFAINFLGAGDEAVADAFGGKSGVSGAERFRAGEWESLSTGAPVYTKALGVFDCTLADVIERGSVSIVIGDVAAARGKGDGAALVFFRGKMRTF
jgi:flavin reductase (DIM6/NTAB) family NADH-FMN oxidoreductase RutF